MITLYGFGNIFPEGRGETRDLRAQWALEETGLAYRVHALDHAGGELDGEAYRRISPFRQVPVIDDDGFVVAESAAVVLYIAEKAGKLIAQDFEGRTRVVQWCFAAVSTVEPTLICLDMFAIFDQENGVRPAQHPRDRPHGPLPELEGVLPALLRPPGVGAHARALCRAARCARRRHPLGRRRHGPGR